MLQRLLVPLDGSRCAERVVPIALRLARANNGTLILLRIVHPNWPSCSQKTFAQELPAMAKFEAEWYLVTLSQGAPFQGIPTEIAPTISRQQIPVTWSIAVNSDVTETILRVAEKGEDVEKSGVFAGCDLMAMSTHGLTGHPFWSLGSITERVRVRTHLPLLIIRPAAMHKPLEYHFSYEPEDVISEA